jgi:hypothetical protein
MYGTAGVSIGGTKYMKFTSANAIMNYLPAGGTAAVLKNNYTNPLTTEAGVFAGQVLALQLNVDFSSTGRTPAGLANLKIAAGNKLAGSTVAQVLATAKSVLGGGALPTGCTVLDLSTLVDRINNNFDNGSQDLGLLVP